MNMRTIIIYVLCGLLQITAVSLFETSIILASEDGAQQKKQTSLTQMLDFNPQAPTSWCDGYGLGVQVFKRKITNGERAYGHGGGNIGTSAYMAYLPEHDVSIAVMINFFHGKCPDRILEDIIEIVTEPPR